MMPGALWRWPGPCIRFSRAIFCPTGMRRLRSDLRPLARPP